MRRLLIPVFVIAGLWAFLAWWGERGLRLQLQDDLGQPTARERLQIREIEVLRGDRLRLERELLRVEQERQRAIQHLGEVVARLQEKRVEQVDAAQEMDPAEREQELALLRTQLAEVRRINRALRMNGGGWIRILSIEGIEGRVLQEVMLSVVGQDGLHEGAYLASQCQILMDRSSGRVRLVMGKGTRFVRRKKIPFDEGLELSFESHWPRLFAKDLHELIIFEGAWPKAEAKPVPSGDLRVLQLWRERLDAFFEALSVHGPRMEIQDLGGVGLGSFQDVRLFGYSKKGILEQRMKAQRMEFWIDKERDRVELRLVDGFVEDDGGRVEFPKRTWRMVLPGMGATEAGKLLAGFVQYVSPPKERK